MRLVVSGLRPYEDPSKYEEELKEPADTVAGVDQAERQYKVFKLWRILIDLGILKLLK
ncbi:MAG: hypothetical protein QXZ47_06140 [Candidatus Bathyarchaeia archaeon]